MLQHLEPVLSRLANLQHTMGVFQGLAAPSNQHAAALAIGVGVALLAGAAGVYIIQGQTAWGKTRRPKALTAEDWKNAFDADGRLLNNGAHILSKVRRGGVAPEIRSEVWPFLLGLHEADSSEGERRKKKAERRRKYLRLRKQVEALSQRLEEENVRREELSRQQAESEALERKKRWTEGEGVRKSDEGKVDGSRTEGANVQKSNREKVDGSKRERSSEVERSQEQRRTVSFAERSISEGASSSSQDRQTSAADESADGAVQSSTTVDQNSKTSSNNASSHLTSSKTAPLPSSSEDTSPKPPNPGEDAQALEEFQTWLRIIRLDAVRMNAAWIPYAPAQASCDPERAEEMARAVGLENDEHLEPARRAHAARLVGILEAYAVYDKETGYCQGMSDLLSPFVALIESDSEAFWCFQRFMRTAKHNFRIDEKGIRGQLNRIAAILERGDPELYCHLSKIGAGDCIFAYRMVVVLFRRELSFEQTLGLWEVCWADALATELLDEVKSAVRTVGGTIENPDQKVPTRELLLYTIAAAVRQRRKKIFEECMAMDEVLKECNAMANNIDLWRTLQDARALVQVCERK